MSNREYLLSQIDTLPDSVEIRNIIDIILQTVMPERIYLFGSYADGLPNEESDYDFYVVIADDSERPVIVTERIYLALIAKTGRKPVDILVKTLSDFEGRKNLPTIEREVVTKGVLLYGAA